jgi:hypothetical protein
VAGYNLGFMPVTYYGMSPRTMWRGLLETVRLLQSHGVHFTIESFGPFGAPQHGHPSSYNFATIFACYRVGLGNDYSTVPTAEPLKDLAPKSAAGLHYALAYMAYGNIPLFDEGKRIDTVWTAAHKRALADYHAVLPRLGCRVMQEDGLGVLWESAYGGPTTLFNFKSRRLPLAGRVYDVTADRRLPIAATYQVEASHTYTIQQT